VHMNVFPKLSVEGSIPFARSNLNRLGCHKSQNPCCSWLQLAATKSPKQTASFSERPLLPATRDATRPGTSHAAPDDPIHLYASAADSPVSVADVREFLSVPPGRTGVLGGGRRYHTSPRCP
jgi:hypothetical protein